MPKQLTDDQLEQIAQGDDDDAGLELEPEGEVIDDVDEEPPDEAAAPRSVPYDRFQEKVEEVNRLNDMLANLSQAVQQRQPAQPSAPAKPSYARPDDTPERKAWRDFVGETVDPVVEARLAEAKQMNNQVALATAVFISEQRARSQFPDYARFSAQINASVEQFYRQTGTLPPNAHELAYYIAKGQAAVQNGGARKGVVKRAASAAAGESAPPARPSGKRNAQAMTADRVKNMTLKEMDEYLNKANARV